MAIRHRKILGAGGAGLVDDGDANTVSPTNWDDDHKYDIPVSLGGYLVLTNIGASYDTIIPAQRGLGFVEMYMDGIDEIVFSVRVNKVGTGTQNWQLWNETDGTQVALIADAAAAADNKYLTVTVTGLALTGLKRLRVRANSTVAADDPVYYGASVIFRKTT